MRGYLPPAMIAGALILSATGVLDQAGLEGASRGLAVGAVICAPIWLVNIWRLSRKPDQDD